MHSSTISQPRSPHGTSPGAACGAEKPMRRLPIRIARSSSARDALAPAAVDAVEFEQMRGRRSAALQLIDVDDVEPVVGARIVVGRIHRRPSAARSASRPIRPMPLMPTRIVSASALASMPTAPSPISSRRALQRHAVERGERQVDEDLDPAMKAGVQLVQQQPRARPRCP